MARLCRAESRGRPAQALRREEEPRGALGVPAASRLPGETVTRFPSRIHQRVQTDLSQGGAALPGGLPGLADRLRQGRSALAVTGGRRIPPPATRVRAGGELYRLHAGNPSLPRWRRTRPLGSREGRQRLRGLRTTWGPGLPVHLISRLLRQPTVGGGGPSEQDTTPVCQRGPPPGRRQGA